MFQLSAAPIDARELTGRLRNASSGAFVAFEGWVRDHNEGRAVVRLEYEAYASLALKEGGRIIAEARERFTIDNAVCIHRTGELQIGAIAVWVGVTAGHRDAAFAACRYIIDQTKDRVPIWKREHYADGTAEWVNCAAAADNQR